MTERYNPAQIEPKWQEAWDRLGTFRTPDAPASSKAYILDMFPYPSAAGLHVGHPEGYTATDIVARYRRARGVSVLHPMGWDAFGLPAEQHAIRTGTHPRRTTLENIETFKRQLKMLGFSYDWDREINTTDPAYVRWTQWIFLLLFRRGLAYQAEVPVNWCPELGTVLANEEVKDGRSEIGGFPVERVPLRQWMLRITAYSDRLLDDLALTEWPESTRMMQREWIGRSEGAEVYFPLAEDPSKLVSVFTTRPDTLFGATFVVLAPEHPLVDAVTSSEQRAKVDDYVAKARSKSDLERTASKEKTGVFTGGSVMHPLTGKALPVWVADYVLAEYGTGAVMAVPAHDARDFEFANAHELPIVEVIRRAHGDASPLLEVAFEGEGVAVNSGPFDGLATAECKRRITAALEEKGAGTRRTQTKLRDWVFSRQRYWGEPIPIVFPVETAGDPRSGDDYVVRYDQPAALEADELPLELPELDDFRPGRDPAGPLARAVEWRFVKRNGRWFARETNTMPQWAGSCWYYLRFLDPANADAPWSKEAAKQWLPVDLYVGGAEHAVLHLLYARFWHKVLFDEGLVPTPEPFAKLVHQGMILGEVEYTSYRTASGDYISADRVASRDGGWYDLDSGLGVEPVKLAEADTGKNKQGAVVLRQDERVIVDARAHKMSKSRGNVVNPDEIVARFGADAMRVFEMFMGPLEATKPWNTNGLAGVRRFLERAYDAVLRAAPDAVVEDELQRCVHRTIRKVTEDIESLRFNTAISAMMILVNELQRRERIPRQAAETLAVLLHPFAPHLAEEAWERLGHPPSIQAAPWPSFDPALCEEDEVEVPVQVNGKVRARILLARGAAEDDAVALARQNDRVAAQMAGKTVVKTVWVPGKILNFIVRG